MKHQRAGVWNRDYLSTSAPESIHNYDKIRLKNYVVYEKMWRNMVQLDRPQMTIYVSHALCILIIKTTNTHTQNM
jgi:hypothetical protein